MIEIFDHFDQPVVIGSSFLYCHTFNNSNIRMTFGRVIGISPKGTIYYIRYDSNLDPDEKPYKRHLSSSNKLFVMQEASLPPGVDSSLTNACLKYKNA